MTVKIYVYIIKLIVWQVSGWSPALIGGAANINIYLNRKDGIILSTIELIDELGFQGLTIKKICQRQEFSEGSLYKHFRSKDEIILGGWDYYSKFDEDIKQTIDANTFSSKESITYFIARLAEYYGNYPAMTAILNSYEIFRNEVGVSCKIIQMFEFRYRLVRTLIEEGIKAGELPSNIDSENLSDIILGS